ncbi:MULTISPECIES: hypothetical protein [Methylomonas]|uniref:Uncharacterized protein n=2 Tax=Methylomonas TaxID=416 RepID=A0A126T1L6_9GAMM|nr:MULTISPECIES: hypothetical protein [Methylomonas]AMK75975.1 hypothetical protein JT25_005630 [Methylomonas denitrificans]OAH99890.1 hypothetical protein A1342_17145 [Methylomonas methanica]TCV84006.1 hypothetical protein EDE11_108138 [Methylomonas methanica]
MSGNTLLADRKFRNVVLTRLTFIHLPWIGVNTRVANSRAGNPEPVANWRQTLPVYPRWVSRRLLPSKVWKATHHLGMLMCINMPMRAFMISDVAMNADISDMAVVSKIVSTNIDVLNLVNDIDAIHRGLVDHEEAAA